MQLSYLLDVHCPILARMILCVTHNIVRDCGLRLQGLAHNIKNDSVPAAFEIKIGFPTAWENHHINDITIDNCHSS